MPPIVTLLTDFGSRDSYVAEMKGALLSVAPTVCVVDVTHDVPPGDVRLAQYLLRRTWKRFPAGTVHLAVVDPGVGTARRALAVAVAGHRFVGPDNGLLTAVFDGAEVVELARPAAVSATFHGRDVFAPAAGRIAQGTAVSSLGPPVANPVRVDLPIPRSEGGTLVGDVIHVDRFGTLVTNIEGGAVRGGAVVIVAGRTVPLGRTFGDVAPGDLVAFVGSDDTIEVAVRDGSAADVLGVARDAAVLLPGGG